MGLFGVINAYENAWRFVDHRVDGWFFMSSIQPVLLMVSGALIIGIYGPVYMKNRTPLKINKTLMIFNLVIIILNLQIAIKGLACALNLNYNWICQLSAPTVTDGYEMELVKTSHLFFLVKLLELCDSIFLIIRKNANVKITVLVLHHSFTAICAWHVVRWYPSGSTFFPGMFTSFVHVIFYSYFFFTVSSFRLAKSKYYVKLVIAIFSILQALVILTHSLILIWVECPVAPMVPYANLGLILCMITYYVVDVVVKFRYNDSGRGLKFQMEQYTTKLMSD